MIKTEFYDVFGSGFSSPCVGTQRDPEKHNATRKSLSATFSTKAMVEQEDIINNCIDGFVDKLGGESKQAGRGINMTKWFEMVAFDILGEMAFGESFGCVDAG